MDQQLRVDHTRRSKSLEFFFFNNDSAHETCICTEHTSSRFTNRLEPSVHVIDSKEGGDATRFVDLDTVSAMRRAGKLAVKPSE